MPAPTAGVIDSQSVKTTEAGGPRGYDAGKNIKGRKRHIVTNMLEGVVQSADVQHRDELNQLYLSLSAMMREWGALSGRDDE